MHFFNVTFIIMNQKTNESSASLYDEAECVVTVAPKPKQSAVFPSHPLVFVKDVFILLNNGWTWATEGESDPPLEQRCSTNASEYSQAWPSSVKSCVLWSKTKGIYFDNLFQSIVINTIFHSSFLGVFPSFIHVEGKDIISYISVHKCKALVKKPRL